MKSLLLLVIVASILVSLPADAKTEEHNEVTPKLSSAEGHKEKNYYQLHARNERTYVNLGRKFEGGRSINGAKDVMINNLAGKMGSNADPAAVGGGKGEAKTSNKASNGDEDNNESFGNYGNSSGSSTETSTGTHHVYTDDHKPVYDRPTPHKGT